MTPLSRRGALARPLFRAVTLLELLVAMGILLALGTSLMLVLRGGLATWRRGEARRETFDAAQAVLRQLREDLRNAIPPHAHPLTGTGEVEARLLADLDPDSGLFRLFLVRAIKAESEHPVTGLAGGAIGADGVLDYRGDLEEAREARLRATGGAMEVAWVHGPDQVLYRGVKAPIGPPGSLFADQDPYELPAGPAAEAESDTSRPALLRPFAREVLHFGLRFWTQYTTTWSLSWPCRKDLDQREESGPLEYWDSTRGMLEFPLETRDERRFATFLSAGSRLDPRDDVFPAKVLVELTLREPPAAGSSTFLSAPVGPGEKELLVQEPGRLPARGFLLLEQEWIEYREVVGRSVLVERRGARGTTAAAHEAETEVLAGRTFVDVIAIPAFREDWGDAREPAR